MLRWRRYQMLNNSQLLNSNNNQQLLNSNQLLSNNQELELLMLAD